MTNKFTIISQIITLLHVSTLSCHPQGACNQYLCQVTQVFQMQLLVLQFEIKIFHTRFMQILILQSLESQYYKMFKTLNLSYLQLKRPKLFCCYNSHEVTLCDGPIYNLHVDAAVELVRYVLSPNVWSCVTCFVMHCTRVKKGLLFLFHIAIILLQQEQVTSTFLVFRIHNNSTNASPPI